MRSEFSRSGVEVRSRYDTTRIGVTLGAISDSEGEVLVRVQFRGEPPTYAPLEELELASEPVDEESLISQGRYAPSSQLRRTLTSVQLSGDLSQLIYSMDMTNTDFMPHQFKPLLALLDSPSRGVLIADEVGLGKTIEAGLIWTELRFRTNATNMLVVCPAMLIDKWRLELTRRFGTASEVMSPAELLEWIDAPRQQPHAKAIICSMQGLRPPRDWADDKRPSDRPAAKLARRLKDLEDSSLFDVTVIDEAHYLRNEDTATAKLGRLLRPVSEYFVMLSATPVNTRSEDLFNLVSLVDPYQFQFARQFDEVLQANRPLVRAANRLKRPACTADDILEELEAVSEAWLLSESKALQALVAELELLDASVPLSPAIRVEFVERLRRANLLGHAIVRSRKAEVFTNRARRSVYYLQARMTDAEKRLYTAVTEAIIGYSLGHAGVEGFLLAMPQQMMSSCMYAAAKAWWSGDDAGVDEDAFAFDSLGLLDHGDTRPVRSHVERAVRGVIDLVDLQENDSKFEKLLEILRQRDRESGAEKYLVFSFFRGTLAYLKSRLEKEGYPCAIVQGGDDKQATIDRFRDDPQLRILLATEVAAEGVDLQFMSLLVNYDLPWNPMRVEQRIGRLDRIGQQSEVITVINLVYEDTIDARILARLYQRLGLFEDSVGATDDVVGARISELTQQLLSSRMTERQAEAAVEEAYFAIEQRKRDLALVEENESDLIGLGDYVRDRIVDIHQRRRSIGDRDLMRHLCDFLDADAPGHELRLSHPGAMTGLLRLPAPVAVALEQFRQQHHLPRSRLESNHAEPFLIRNHVDSGGRHGREELINQFHPLIRMIAAAYRPEQNGPAVFAVELSCRDLPDTVPAGTYAFVAESWRFEGMTKESTIGCAFVSLADATALPQHLGFDLLNAVRAEGREWVRAAVELPPADTLPGFLDTARQIVARARSREVARHRSENSDRANIQRQSVTRNRDYRVSQLRASIQRHREAGRVGLEKADLARLQRVEEQAEVHLARIDSRQDLRIVLAPLVCGFLKVNP